MFFLTQCLDYKRKKALFHTLGNSERQGIAGGAQIPSCSWQGARWEVVAGLGDQGGGRAVGWGTVTSCTPTSIQQRIPCSVGCSQ